MAQHNKQQDNKQVDPEQDAIQEWESEFLPNGMTVDDLRQEILALYPGTTIEQLEYLGF